jgi:hypothetical protein
MSTFHSSGFLSIFNIEISMVSLIDHVHRKSTVQLL